MDSKHVVEVLNDMLTHGVIQEYALGGAVAAALYVEPFYTKDFDVFIAIEQSGNLIDLSPIYTYLTKRGYEAKGQWVVIGGWDVEFLPAYNSLTDEALRNARPISWGDAQVRIMKPEHLVAICLQTGRPKDYERIAKFIAEDAFDLATARAILIEHGLLEKWDAFMRSYKQESPQ